MMPSSDQAVIAELDSEADARINRIFWEGGFFLIVLLGGLTIMTRTIRLDAELRRRQQNFLAAVSHEFKSPLASIRLAAETLTRHSDSAEDIQRLGNRILADDERLLRMVENLLDTTRLEEGQHQARRTSTHRPSCRWSDEIIDFCRMSAPTEHQISRSRQ